jgi:predicted amidohydrolase
MPRNLRLAALQMGPTQLSDTRSHTLDRLIALLESGAQQGAKFMVFPELALTTFFPRWLLSTEAVDQYCETAMPNPQVAPLFDKAKALGVGFYIGYAELLADGRRFNSAITVDGTGQIIGHYRKVHLPGSVEPREGELVHQLEKRYFEYGDYGFPAFKGPDAWHAPIMGALICNDRRWPEAWRAYGLQGVELMVMGYNSAAYDPGDDDWQN